MIVKSSLPKSRPAAEHSCRSFCNSVFITSGERKIGHQPSPHRATHLSAFLSLLPISTGGPPFRAGFGYSRTGGTATDSAPKQPPSLVHTFATASQRLRPSY